MPVLKHAKKKLRQDKNRTLRNKKVRTLYRELIKKAKLEPTAASISAAFKQIDKAAKNNIMHKNKAGRLKSALSKLTLGSKNVVAPQKKKTSKKTVSKKSVTKKK